MSYRQTKYLIRLFLNKFLATFLYEIYVKKNAYIVKDIQNNIVVRQIKDKENIRKNFSHLLLHYPEFAFIFFKRINNNISLFSWFYNSNSMYCKIFNDTKLEGGVVCFHPFATVINAKKIGENFIFRNSITVGNKNNDNNLRPTIGNNVEIGANAIIIGDVVIGDNVLIGAGTVVVKNVPSNSIAYGNPLVIKSK